LKIRMKTKRLSTERDSSRMYAVLNWTASVCDRNKAIKAQVTAESSKIAEHLHKASRYSIE